MIFAETERIELREIDPVVHAPFFLELLNSPGFIKYVGDRNVRTVEQAEQYLKDRAKKITDHPAGGAYIVYLKERNIPIGNCGLFIRKELEVPDIGFSFLPEFEDKGYAYEACIPLIYHAKAHNLQRVNGITVDYNHRSIKLLEKLGLKFEKRFFMEGDPEELMLYSKDLNSPG
jgi:[ribosomal protein S5]-alanine N-acetyltransferase